MKRIILLLGLLLVLHLCFAATAPPVKDYCENQGYEYSTKTIINMTENRTEYNTTKFYCKISDNLTCDAFDFYAYKCGVKNSTKRPCVKEGEVVWTSYGDRCCKGTEPSLPSGVRGQATCVEKVAPQDEIMGNISEKAGIWKLVGAIVVMLFILIVIVIGTKFFMGDKGY
ncbi:hypothetical protein AYK26_06380 [Euryarchaeota archaeon SM23-78]|nr:MAG: hypothetical protein AYK26_06380 [Euryarchaeota archaeon SM23-78]MBW3001062.1 hypothetical protein [Candidatus Woesearchaeota archaeon]